MTGPEWGQFFCPNENRKMKTAEDAGDAEDFWLSFGRVADEVLE